ncbi:potassium transporter Kef [Thalassotalea insulae]|uniref:Potassium transporter Kef n=1 Tax=Thalassotalea insulae TaxID=2056778 RepID=A0ABQ6GZW6_9GAMM|nr:cation:proton antiporter family protein [Thalassotalea insulae]GLX80161.1 potassium transporter Kef [Thalassotalea insulae]
MDFIWILFAFSCGLAAKLITLPPSIGYLAAGFILHFLGFQADSMVLELANLGITLMLFTIGLKLNIRDITKMEVWGTSLSHTAFWLLIILILIKLVAIISLPFISDLNWQSSAIVVFALSFSSTVCVVKLMEDHGEMKTRHGKLAVGILVVQDIIAVIFLVAATGKMPSWYAVLLVLALPLRPILGKLLNKAGHGELLPLTGFFIAFGSYELFELLHIKGDLGALLAGMYLATHSKSTEITKSLLNFKDLFLIGFFLSIGFTALPTWEMLATASLITLLLPIKFLLFFILATKFKLRARSAFLSALALTNFSEFGLIIASLSTQANWLAKEWLVILSLAVAISFITTNICYNFAHKIYSRYKEPLKQYEHAKRLPEDEFTQPVNAPIMIVGMGRVGLGAYRALDSHIKNQVWGLDTDRDKVNRLTQQDIHAYYGDAEDVELWEKINLSEIRLALLALPSVEDIANITAQLKNAHFAGQIAAIARYDDERIALEQLGVDKVFNFYAEAGVGFAEESMSLYQQA